MDKPMLCVFTPCDGRSAMVGNRVMVDLDGNKLDVFFYG